MSLRRRSFKLPKIPRQQVFVTILLGLAGFLLNTVELQLGWGMQFIFGNALVFAFMRVLAPQMVILGISISSLWTIFIWHHPWAWIVCVCEAIFIAFVGRSRSIVRRDLVFWLMLGTPLLFLTYGLVMKFHGLSLALVVAKQSTNGILNVVLGELFYVAIIGINKFGKFDRWPKLTTESVVISVITAINLIPITVYLAFDAPAREKAARDAVGRSLEIQLTVSNAALNSWIQSRSLVLRMHAADKFDENGAPKQHLLDELAPDFEQIVIAGPGRKLKWSASPNRKAEEMADRQSGPNNLSAQRAVRLINVSPSRPRQSAQFKLLVPFYANDKVGIIEAKVRTGVLHNLVNSSRKYSASGIFLVSATQGALPLNQVPSSWAEKVRLLSSAQRMEALRSPILLSDMGNVIVAMSDLRNAQIIRSTILADLPEWQVVGVVPLALAPAVIRDRQIQLRQLLAIMIFCLIVVAIGTVLSARVSQTLTKLSQLAAALAASGAAREPADRLIIHEVSEILGQITSAGQTFGRERGTLASYRRRLSSIAQHAPVIVYALDVIKGSRGTLVYVSESSEKILGYTTTDIGEPGWWNSAIHPDDELTCNEAFGSLLPDQLVNIEYRMQHKDGHYVWVYDSLSVETNSHTGQLEAVGVLIDISDRKAAAEQLLQADKMASLGRLISGTAHELNQPLNFIKMTVSNLRENTLRGRLDPELFLPKLANILGQVERASAILLQMRIFGRTPKEMPYPVDLKAVVDTVLMMVGPQFEFDGTQVEIEERGGIVHVQALPVLIEQVLLNLLLNANDAIKTRYGHDESARGRIRVSVERRDELAVVVVEDNGTGITADALRKIFDPFFTTKAPKEGTGLGLSISYGIIRDLGGVIHARSTQKGARFTIELPLVERDAA